VSVFDENGAYVFKTEDGLAIYTYARDTPGRSACTDACAQAWPPVIAPPDGKSFADWTVVDRGGSRQWAYKGRPIYTFARDAPGAARGDGVGGVWALVRP
jgi:predicted lipoprotein with Yx(FWY)xxD motif